MFKIEKNFLLRVLMIGIIVFIINTFFFQICFVDGKSMEPTLRNKQVILINKFDMNLKNNDVIVIKKNNKTIIKRLIAMPNDTIRIDNYVYVNDEPNDDIVTKYAGLLNNEIRLGENEYCVLGDNRGNSIDSRFDEIGIIHRNEIIGKMIK